MNVQLVVSDLDGTLLDDNHELSENVRKCITDYIKADGLFTIATGRNWYAARGIIKSLGIDIPVILSNGAVLVYKNRIIYQALIELDNMYNFFTDACNFGLTVLLFEHDKVYGFGHKRGVERFSHKEKVKCQMITVSREKLKGIKAQKVVLIGAFEKSLELWMAHDMFSRKEYGFMQSEIDFFEIVRSGEDKGKAMLRLAQLLGVNKNNILAIGNQMNDKEMIIEAGIGAAVANSPKELKELADFVCINACGEGVKEVIEKFCKYSWTNN